MEQRGRWVDPDHCLDLRSDELRIVNGFEQSAVSSWGILVPWN